ncbi:GlxA family transcriptional regulator [Cryobacterium sp. TMT4-31]|uniref:GlxA family transcriptional regulator n=1 Tax=Cryobacterium sp. TMT4-31 TaxID=1259259 RepID=UPI00106ABD12|nr:helix-turn-helix domain-containing protein [Cryobacterium sp. TMT4-31]TFC86371.1 helix-turn-helix domain-containing protein [Cryobacterium sp. TMT4-31]
MHTIAVLALDDLIVFDLATPIEIFGRARLPGGGPAYRVKVCAAQPTVRAGSVTLSAQWGLEELLAADTIIIPGLTDPSAVLSGEVRDTLREAAGRGTRIASICVGAFTLAATGLLDGLSATTHWMAAEKFAAEFPQVKTDASVLYIDNGQILTSAGAAAGMDLCLHMIYRDYGAAVAADTARLAVVPLERQGGQSQFITQNPRTSEGTGLAQVLVWLEANAHKPITLGQIAEKARISTRTLNRQFQDQTGMTPVHWLRKARIRQAQSLLETTDHSIERIGRQVGFASTTNFRDTFKKTVGPTPANYRRAFRPSSQSQP